MTCFNSRYAWLSSELNENGKQSLIFDPSGRSVNDESFLQLPCGHCEGCRADKARIWSVRMYHEQQLWKECCFLTLTYADSCQKKILKQDLQNFFKRLRHFYSFRYFACGEYGETTRRPHYHAVIFGQDFLGGSYPIDDQLYGNKIIEKIWKHGMVAIAPVTMASIQYVAGYVQKKLASDDETFQLMSRKPGIGKGWLDKYYPELVRNGFVWIEGMKLDIPRQYLRWYEYEFRDVIEERKENVVKYTKGELRSKRINLIKKVSNKKVNL